MATATLTGQQLATITREMVRLTSRHYGRGGTEGKTYQCDELVFSALEGGLTPAERDLPDHGDVRLVREPRYATLTVVAGPALVKPGADDNVVIRRAAP